MVHVRPLMLAFAVAFLALEPAVGRANLIETFESPNGTDNTYPQTLLSTGNTLDPNYTGPGRPSSWGTKSGEVVVGPDSGGAAWIHFEPAESETGYVFSGSFDILNSQMDPNTAITLFISKPAAWLGPLAAWRLYFWDMYGQLELMLVLGWNSDVNNPTALFYKIPISTGEVYNVSITYDNQDQYYLWSVNGQLEASGKMPDGYPLIGTEIIGSSGSSNGRDAAYLVDNVSWTEIPESSLAVPEPPAAGLLGVGLLGLVLACGWPGWHPLPWLAKQAAGSTRAHHPPPEPQSSTGGARDGSDRGSHNGARSLSPNAD